MTTTRPPTQPALNKKYVTTSQTENTIKNTQRYMCIHMYIYIYIYTHIHTYIYIYISHIEPSPVPLFFSAALRGLRTSAAPCQLLSPGQLCFSCLVYCVAHVIMCYAIVFMIIMFYDILRLLFCVLVYYDIMQFDYAIVFQLSCLCILSLSQSFSYQGVVLRVRVPLFASVLSSEQRGPNPNGNPLVRKQSWK